MVLIREEQENIWKTIVDNVPEVYAECNIIPLLFPTSSAILRFPIFNRKSNNKESDWHTMCIHGQMYFGVEPPFVLNIF